MKKKYALLVSLLTMLILGGCKKDQLHEPVLQNTQLVANAQLWYNKQIEINKQSNKSFVVPNYASPSWNDYQVKETAPQEYLIYVKTKGREITNPDLATISSLVFTYTKGTITSAKMIEVIGESAFIKTQSLQFTEKYQDKTIPDFTKGAFILYDMQYKVQSTHIIENGVENTGTTTAIKRIKNGQLKEIKVNGKTTHLVLNDQQKTKLRTASTGSCEDIYWVTYELGTGRIISIEYLYTSCEGDDGGNPPGDGDDDDGSGDDGSDNGSNEIAGDTPALREFENDYKTHMSTSELQIYNSMGRFNQVVYLTNAQQSLELAASTYPGDQHNTVADAFRHAYFSLENASKLGLSLATSLGNAHEEVDGQPQIEKLMDLYNNDVGRRAASSEGRTGMNDIAIVKDLVESGKLEYINSDGELVPTNW